MRKPKLKTVTVDLKKVVNPWGNDKKVKEEVKNALKNLSDNPEPFNCIKCGINFQPKPWQWIFYRLCDSCFKEFDTQKMLGRYETLKRKNRHVKHYEDVDEWLKHVKN